MRHVYIFCLLDRLVHREVYAVDVCVFITAVPLIKLFAWGEGRVEDICYERRRAEAGVDCLPITWMPFVCVYYCSTYYKAVRVGGGG